MPAGVRIDDIVPTHLVTTFSDQGKTTTSGRPVLPRRTRSPSIRSLEHSRIFFLWDFSPRALSRSLGGTSCARFDGATRWQLKAVGIPGNGGNKRALSLSGSIVEFK